MLLCAGSGRYRAGQKRLTATGGALALMGPLAGTGASPRVSAVQRKMHRVLLADYCLF